MAQKGRVRGHSSAGRAPALHAGGREFDPPWLHHYYQNKAHGDVCFVLAIAGKTTIQVIVVFFKNSIMKLYQFHMIQSKYYIYSKLLLHRTSTKLIHIYITRQLGVIWSSE